MGFVKLDDLDDNLKYRIDYEFSKIYEKYKNLVYYVTIRIVKIQVIAEEITNDAFLILFNHLENINDKTKIKSYLTTTAKRLAYQHIEEYNKQHEILDNNYDILNIPDDHTNYNESWESLLLKFKKYLTPEELDLIIKVIYFEYTIPEIAAETNQNIFTVASKVRRAKIKLKKFYNEQEGEIYGQKV